ncbi:MAG: type II secretion system F family protein [Betaproteobacteria bacterium]|nr:type II secretion system F family protein [Betaproteobacteria bacterium]
MDSLYLLLLMVFLAVALFLEGLYVAWNAHSGPEARRIARRLQLMSAGGDGSEASVLAKQRLLSSTPAVERLLLQIPRVHVLDRLLVQSGVKVQVAGFLGLILIMAVIGVALGIVLGWMPGLVLLLTLALMTLPWLYVLNARQKRLDMLEQQLPDALDLMGRAMLAGHAFPSALKMVGDEMPQPVSGEFRVVFDEINYGIPIQDAMSNLATRVPSTDLRYFVISVLIQRETGGNLAELLGNISALIRARLKLLGTVRVLAAEGVLSAKILTALPFVLAFAINLLNPGFLAQLWTDPMGLKLVWAAFGLMLIGIFWMWRIIKIRI